MIKPTIGRVVWFHRAGASVGDQPWPALVCYVHNDHLINVAGFDNNGSHFACQCVGLVQEGEQYPDGGENYACWMPYQQQQAKKHEMDSQPEATKGLETAFDAHQKMMAAKTHEEFLKAQQQKATEGGAGQGPDVQKDAEAEAALRKKLGI
jgi:hypothetical protein